MRNLLKRYAPSFAPEGAGSGGGDGGQGGGAGAGAASDGSTPGTAANLDAGNGSGGDGGAAAGGDGQGAAAGGDAAPTGQPAAGAGQLYRPQGLPETMYGKSNEETIDKLKAAFDGYRSRDSQAGIPDNPEAYRDFSKIELDDKIKPHIDALAKDPLFDAVSKVALEEKAPVGLVQKLTAALYQQAAESGILEAPIDVAQERQNLIPDTHRNLAKAEQDKAINARLEANEQFIDLMVQQGLDKDVGEHAKLMLMDTAAGNKFFEFFRDQVTGAGSAQPGAGGQGGGGDTPAALRAELAKPEMQVGHPSFNKQKHAELQERYKRAHGNGA